MVIFHSYVKLPEGMYDVFNHQPDIEYVGVDPPFLPVISPA